MVQLINFRCEKCGADKPLWWDTNPLIKQEIPFICKCGGKFKEFNFKNNSQRARIFDKKEGENK